MEADKPIAAVNERSRRQDNAAAFEVQQWQAMEQPKWNEARLDDLSARVDRGFERVDERFDNLQRMLFWAAVSIVITLIGAPHL
jgi:hypothetical protein